MQHKVFWLKRNLLVPQGPKKFPDKIRPWESHFWPFFLWRHNPAWPSYDRKIFFSNMDILYTVGKKISSWLKVPLEPMSRNRVGKSYTRNNEDSLLVAVVNFNWRQCYNLLGRREWTLTGLRYGNNLSKCINMDKCLVG